MERGRRNLEGWKNGRWREGKGTYQAVKLVEDTDGVDGLVLEIDGLWEGVLGGVADGYEAVSSCS